MIKAVRVSATPHLGGIFALNSDEMEEVFPLRHLNCGECKRANTVIAGIRPGGGLYCYCDTCGGWMPSAAASDSYWRGVGGRVVKYSPECQFYSVIPTRRIAWLLEKGYLPKENTPKTLLTPVSLGAHD